MKMINRGRVMCVAVLFIGIAFATSPAPAGSEFDLSWHRISGGGGMSAGGGFTLTGTIGQAEAGSHEGGGFALSGGFWAGAQFEDGVDCPADLNGDGIVNSSDLLELLNSWGSCPGCAADLNNDGVVNSSDLLELLNAWGPCT